LHSREEQEEALRLEEERLERKDALVDDLLTVLGWVIL
jgi:hypothetical protein